MMDGQGESSIVPLFQSRAIIMRLISNVWLILSYTVQIVIPIFCSKFSNPKSCSL